MRKRRVALRRSPRRRAPRPVAAREVAFKTLADNSPDLIARLDGSLRHLYVNRAAQHVFGVNPEALVGHTPAQSGIPDHVARACAAAARDALRSGHEQRFAFALPGRAPQPDRIRHFSGRIIPEFGRNGKAETLLMIVYDITQRVEGEKEREALLAREQAAREQAEAAARARDHFLAIVSHELRSPLNGIQSWAHVLEQQLPDKPPAFERALAGIRLGVEQQVRLIEDLLDATRIVSGQLRLSMQPLRLRPILEAAVQSVRSAAEAKQVQLETAYEIDREQVNGDPDRLQQIAWNLLDNAVKFVPHGGRVRLSATRQGNTLSICVEDNGRGIPADFLPHLFNRFRQADAASTRRHDGLGLGLALVRHLTELHGGRVSAHSAGPGKGAAFHVRLPLHSAPARHAVTPTDTPLPSLEGLRVLIVDDQQEARESIAALLTNAGAGVLTAASGREALHVLEDSPPDALPDVLICDIAMPEEDGYQTLRNVRDWESRRGVRRPMPAVALTAFSLREDRIRALAAGYKMHLAKPVAPAELIIVIATVAGPARAATA